MKKFVVQETDPTYAGQLVGVEEQKLVGKNPADFIDAYLLDEHGKNLQEDPIRIEFGSLETYVQPAK